MCSIIIMPILFEWNDLDLCVYGIRTRNFFVCALAGEYGQLQRPGAQSPYSRV